MIPESWLPVANHLWQSTLFAAAAGLLTLALRKNPARVRHWVWVIASVKFLAPFAILMALGSQVPWHAKRAPNPRSISRTLDQVSQPFAAPVRWPEVVAVISPAQKSALPEILGVVWACGFLAVGTWWAFRWRRVAAAVRAGSPVDLGLPIRVISSASFMEPGVFGALRPVLLLPEGIFESLSPEQWKAVLAHELCHVRRRDNLIGLLQMFVQTVFWFHPMVWWIGKQIFAERERACDEEVLRSGSRPLEYARGILKVCELYLESPAPCVAGVSGSNLRRRIEAILTGKTANLDRGRRVLLAAAGVSAVALPIAIGLLDGLTVRAQNPSPDLKFEVASVRPSPPADGRGRAFRNSGIPGSKNNTDPGRFVAQTSLGSLLLMAYHLQSYQLSGADDLYLVPLDVQAKMPVDTTLPEFEVMLQNLLAERFALKAHWGAREMTLYELTVAKGGPKMKAAAPDSPALAGVSKQDKPAPFSGIQFGPDGYPAPPPGNGRWMAMARDRAALRGHNETAADMAQEFAPQVGGPVTDATGLNGRYDYTVFWSTAATGNGLTANAAADPDGPSLFEAIEQQLGLKLEKKKGTVKMLFIDHIEKTPTEN